MRAQRTGPVEGWRPPSRITWRDAASIGPIIALTVYRYVGTSLTPALIGTHPLLLSGLRGTITSIVTVGAFARVGRAPLWLGLLVPLPILLVEGPIWYWAGRRYGRRLLHDMLATSPRSRRRIARGERLFARHGFWAIVASNVLPAPNALFYIAAGEAEMAFALFILADTIGMVAFVALVLGIGWIAGQRAVTVAETVSHYGWWVTGATVAIAVLFAVRSSRDQLRGRREGGRVEAAAGAELPREASQDPPGGPRGAH